MINIAAEAYKQFEGGKPREYDSLPRNTKSEVPKKSALTNIAAKFRKVKMRRGKDKEKDKFPAVSELCRQSLVVDINASNNQQQVPNSESTACAGNQFQSVTIPKSNSWISRTKLFKH
ncbi:hypothetical protein WA026_014466 [Henosepilachna vigintioctopunctata]|uniref:Uncharacterized protein n=1 Tax=Henosepilachna vigintioctopunctata TaxID=420089 RepID=A0AAW1UKS6_9CUCU